jgi:hypothetical protein
MISRELEAIESSLGDIEEALNSNTDKVVASIDRGAARLAFSLNRGFQAVAWGQDRLIQLSERQSFALQHPRETEAREKIKSGLYAYKNRWWKEAQEDLEAACQVYRYDPTPWLYLGKIAFWVRGDIAEADRLFAEAARFGRPIARSRPLVVEALLEGAQAKFVAGDRAGAADLAGGAVQLEADNPDVLVCAARFCVFAGQAELATRLLTDACNLNPALVLTVGATWAEPIRRTMLDWMAKTFVRELEPSRSIHERLTAIRERLSSCGVPLFEEAAWHALERDYSEISSGFLNLRRGAKHVSENRRRLVQDATNRLKQRINEHETDFRAQRNRIESRLESIRAEPTDLAAAAQKLSDNERDKRQELKSLSTKSASMPGRFLRDLHETLNANRSRWLLDTANELALQSEQFRERAKRAEFELNEQEPAIELELKESDISRENRLEPMRRSLLELQTIIAEI